MSRTNKLSYVVLGIALVAGWQWGTDDAVAAENGGHSQYLVVGSSGPGFASPEEAIMLLEGAIIPSLEHLGASEKVLAGGLPVGARAVAFIIEADSNEDADNFVRSLPMWPLLSWEVTALQSFGARAAAEKTAVAEMKKGN